MEHERQVTRAWVLHPDIFGSEQRRLPEHALEEAVALAVALPDIEVVGSSVVRLPKPHAGMLFGSGKSRNSKRFSRPTRQSLCWLMAR